MNRRENTFRVDYSNVPRKPSFEDIHKFAAESLGLKRGEVERFQCSRTLGCAFVKVINLELAQQIVDEHGNRHVMVCDDKTYRIHIAMEDGAVDVKLTDLSEAVTDEEIEQFLAQYGEILSIREIMWDEKYIFGGASTGVRMVKMIVHHNIDSYVTISGETTSVSYYGQHQTCRHCTEYAHNGISCVQNKKLMLQKSYADATKQPRKQPNKPISKNTKPRSYIGRQSDLPRNFLSAFPALPQPKAPEGDKTTDDDQHQPNDRMLPPSGELALKFTRLQSRTAVQSGSGDKVDGNDTDTSTASTSSRRSRTTLLQRSKKQRIDISLSEQRVDQMETL